MVTVFFETVGLLPDVFACTVGSKTFPVYSWGSADARCSDGEQRLNFSCKPHN